MSAGAGAGADGGAGGIRFFDRVSATRRGIDLAVLGVLLLLAMLGFQPVYGGVQHIVTGAMAILLGFLVALIGARWSWGPLRMALLTIAVHIVLGSVFAAPSHALWGVVPTPASLWEVLREPISTWKSVLTVAPPVGTAQGMLGVEWISMLLLSLGAGTVVMRTRLFLVAWLFPLAAMGVTVVFGTSEAFWPVLRAVSFAVLSIAWLTWRFESDRLADARSSIISDTVGAGSWRNPVLRRRVVGGAAVLAVAAGTAVSAQALLDPPEGSARFALRDTITPPFDAEQYVSPLADYRGYRKHSRETELFTVSGVAPGELIRLATLDDYDGHVYEVASSSDEDSASGAFLRTVTGVDLLEASDDARTATIAVEGYSDVWVPTIGTSTARIELESDDAGRTGALAENLYLNRASQTAIASGGLASGDSITLTYEPYTAPTEQQQRDAVFAEDELPPYLPMSADLEAYAEEWAGDSESDYERMQSLLRGITSEGTFSHGIDEDEAPSLSGHGARRLLAMLEETGYDEQDSDAIQLGMIGDEEQYAALTAVMARSLGIPARVVMGFEVPTASNGTAVITGDDVTAWVEVGFEDIGWVRFDVVPEDDDAPVEETPKEVDQPMPQVAQPPPPPAEPPTQPPGALSEDLPEDPDDPAQAATWVRWVLVASSPVLLLVLALMGIAATKALRRRRRRLRGSPVERMDGGWQEILDLLADLGRRADPVLTRLEVASQLDADLPDARTTALAEAADRAVFGPDEPPEPVVQEHWRGVEAARSAMLMAQPWRRRLRGLLSLRSLRRRTADRSQQRGRERRRTRDREKAGRRTDALRRRRPRDGSGQAAARRKGI